MISEELITSREPRKKTQLLFVPFINLRTHIVNSVLIPGLEVHQPL